MSGLERLTTNEQITVSEYDKMAHIWALTHDTQEFWTPEFEVFENLVSCNSSVVEFGAGGGRDARRLSQRYRYLGTDISSGLISEAKKINPQLYFRQADLYRLPFINSLFDGFWCSATLLHLPKNRVGEALSEMNRVTKNNGTGFISIKEGQGETIVEDQLNGKSFRRFFAYYEQDEFSQILEVNKFKVRDSYMKPVGRTNWLIYIVEKSKPNLKRYENN